MGRLKVHPLFLFFHSFTYTVIQLRESFHGLTLQSSNVALQMGILLHKVTIAALKLGVLLVACFDTLSSFCESSFEDFLLVSGRNG